MVSMIMQHEIGAARMTYEQQIKFGSSPGAALDFAVLGYLKKNRDVPVIEARASIARALGVEMAVGDQRATG